MMDLLRRASRGLKRPPKVEKNAFASGGMIGNGKAMGGCCGAFTTMDGRAMWVLRGI